MINLKNYSNNQLLELKTKLATELKIRRKDAIIFLNNTGGMPNYNKMHKDKPNKQKYIKRKISLDRELPTFREDQEEDNGYDDSPNKYRKNNNYEDDYEYELGKIEFRHKLDVELDDIQKHIRLKIPFNQPLHQSS